MIHPGLLSITFRKLSPEQIVSLAAEAGLAGIEWGGDIHVPHGDKARAAQVRQLTEGAGLVISAYGSYYRTGVSESQGLAFGSVLDAAVELGTSTIRVWAGSLGSAETDSRQRAAITDDLARICDLALPAGVGISLEFHGGTLADSARATMDLIHNVSRPNLTTYWQPPVGMSTEDCLEGLGLVLPHLQNVHVFHWWPDANTRHRLDEGLDRWRNYLRLAAADRRPRHASIEYVMDDDVDVFRADAAALKMLISELTHIA